MGSFHFWLLCHNTCVPITLVSQGQQDKNLLLCLEHEPEAGALLWAWPCHWQHINQPSSLQCQSVTLKITTQTNSCLNSLPIPQVAESVQLTSSKWLRRDYLPTSREQNSIRGSTQKDWCLLYLAKIHFKMCQHECRWSTTVKKWGHDEDQCDKTMSPGHTVHDSLTFRPGILPQPAPVIYACPSQLETCTKEQLLFSEQSGERKAKLLHSAPTLASVCTRNGWNCCSSVPNYHMMRLFLGSQEESK